MTQQPITYKPSQWLNLGYILLGITATYFFWWSIFIPAWMILETYCTKYIFYEDRIIYKRGVLRVVTDELLFYRIKGITLDEPLFYRIVGISILKIKTSDKYVEEMVLNGIKAKQKLFMQIRASAEYQRKKQGVKEFDMYHLN